MLNGKLIHPQIMSALALCGHGDKILIADGNYPLASKTQGAQTVYLGLKPGQPTVTDVLDAILSVAVVESAEVMVPEGGETPEIFAEFTQRLNGMPLQGMGRFEFYDACMAPGAVALAISTGEKRTYSNILLTIGCA